jgi:hypothetical protein
MAIEILGSRRSGLNLPLIKFRQDQLSKGTMKPLLTPVYSQVLDLLFPYWTSTHTLALRSSSRTDRCAKQAAPTGLRTGSRETFLRQYRDSSCT